MSQPVLTESPTKTKQRIAGSESQPPSTRLFQGGLNPILQLQRTLGNHQVAQLIRAKRLTPDGKIIGLQPKLTVGAADDQYEQEADRVARQVVSMPDPITTQPGQQAPQPRVEGDTSKVLVLQSKPLPLAASITPFVQRKPEPTEIKGEEEKDKEGEKEEPLKARFFDKSAALPFQTLTVEEEKPETSLVRSAESLSNSFEAGEEVEARLTQSKGQGSPLPEHVRSFMEPRFGVDFSHVRVHTSNSAIQMNRDVGARAFTHGSDIYYGGGNKPSDLELTAHELTHVVQQAGALHGNRTIGSQRKYSENLISSKLRNQILLRDCDPSTTSCVPEQRPSSSHSCDPTISTAGNRAVQRLLYNSVQAEPAMRNAHDTQETATSAGRSAVAHGTPALPSDQPRARNETKPQTHELHREEEATVLATGESHPVPSFTPPSFLDSSENDNGFVGDGRAPSDAVVGPAAVKAAAPAPATNAMINGNAVDRANLIKADSVHSEAQILKIADTNRKNVSLGLGGLHGRFASFFAQSSGGVRSLISGKQAEISAAAANVMQSAQVVVVNTARTARTQADRVSKAIEGAVKTAIGSVQERVRGIADGITGVVNRFPLPDIPGVAQIRSAIGGVLRRGAGVVTSGLTRLQSLISSALSLGQRLVTSMIGVFERLADAALAQVGNAIQRVTRVVAQILQQVATQVISALQKIFNGSVLPMIARLERMTHQEIGKSQQHAISAIHSNRDYHLQSLVPQSQAKGAAAPAPDGTSNPAPEGPADEAVRSNKTIIQIFQEQSSAILASVLQRISAASSQIVDHVSRSVAQVTQLIAGKIHEVAQALTQAVQAVRSFVQSAVDALTSALNEVITHVRALIDNPAEQLVRFAQGVLDGIIGFVSRIISNIVGFITGGTPSHEASAFNPAPTLAPSPAYLAPALPALFVLLAALVALVGGTVIVVGGTVIIIIGGSVYFVSTTVVIIVAIVLALLLLLLLLYLLYRILKKRPPSSPEKIISETVQPSPGVQTRTDIGVGEEVNLTYTGGSTTWATTGGTLSKPTGPSIRLKAPDTPQAVTVTAGTASITFLIIAPSRVFMERVGDTKHTKGFPDSGIRMRPWLLPDNVNFYNIVYHEMDVNAVATAGEYSCHAGKGHCDAGGGGVPCPDNSVTNTVVASLGTRTGRDDCAYSGFCTVTGPPYAPGSLSFNIPHEYIVVGGSGSAHPFATVSQVHTLKADADTLTTVKAEATGDTTVNARSSSNGC